MMKRITLPAIFCLGLAFNGNAQNTTVFLDNFGTSTVRQTSPYMPTPGFAFGNPTGTNLEKAIENNHYAVIDPVHIKDAYPVPFYWFWTGPEPAGNTSGSAGNAATDDHTTGDANGAVMVINAGSTLTPFYDRATNLQSGGIYKLSWWIYLVNAPSQIAADIIDYSTGSTLASMSTAWSNTTGVWTEFSVAFNMPSGCINGGGVRVVLRNALNQLSGNDYYIDDVLLEQLPSSATPGTAIACPTASIPLPVDLINFKLKSDAGNVYLDWTTANEVNLQSYIVQKSTDGINFIPLAYIPAKNNSSLNNYQYTDRLAAVAGETKLYYRLAIQNNDQTTRFSNVQQANISTVSSLMLYPNPTNNGLIRITGVTADDVINITDPLGRQLLRINDTGEATKQINLNSFNSGIYIISVLHKDGTTEYFKALNQK
jgi:hypothetical protein